MSEAVHQTEKEHDGLASKLSQREYYPAVVPGSSFSRTFGDQRLMHNKKAREAESDMERNRKIVWLAGRMP